jgi:hypothetical protein
MAQRRRLSLSEEQRRELCAHRDHDPRPDARERCAAVLQIAAGAAPHAVARRGLLRPRDPDTVYGWLASYEAGGLVGLLARRHGGARRRWP